MSKLIVLCFSSRKVWFINGGLLLLTVEGDYIQGSPQGQTLRALHLRDTFRAPSDLPWRRGGMIRRTLILRFSTARTEF